MSSQATLKKTKHQQSSAKSYRKAKESKKGDTKPFSCCGAAILLKPTKKPTSISKLVKRLDIHDPDLTKWKEVLNNNLRVVTHLSFLNEPANICQSLSTTGSWTIVPNKILWQHFTIEIREDADDKNKRWEPIFEVNRSGLGEGTGYGLFACRDFKKNDVIGVYYGKIFDFDEEADHKDRPYALEIDWPPHSDSSRKLHVDAMGGASNKKKTAHPIYFGMQFLQDPTIWYDENHTARPLLKKDWKFQPNCKLCKDLEIQATKDIRAGDEIFVIYGVLEGKNPS
jgi:hypothetical protein